MVNHIIHQIILRIAKENNCIQLFKKHYSIHKTNIQIGVINFLDISFSLSSLVEYNLDLSFFLENNSNNQLNKQFILIFTSFLKPFLISFCKEYQIDENIFHQWDSNLNCNINNYVYLKSPWNIIKRRELHYLSNDIHYWYETDRQYQQYITNILSKEVKNANN